MKLSIIMPVYNEEKTLKKIVELVQKVNLGKVKKEIIIVDDSSKDNSQKIINQLKKKFKNIKSVMHKKNQGKGAAIRTGIKYSTGDLIVIQDGDLEYNPEEFKKMLKPILEKKTSVVYGSRFIKKPKIKYPLYYLGNRFVSLATSILYGKKITDMETCYKMIPRKIFLELNITSNHFDIEPEITAKLLKKGYNILEVPITYNCRSFEEGKKINWKDGIIAFYTLGKYRFFKI